MSLTKHIMNSKGVHLASIPAASDLTNVAATVEGKSVDLQAEDNVVITNSIAQYPYPIKLEEGVIVQDTDQVPFEGKWRPAKEAKEAKELKAKRDEAAKS